MRSSGRDVARALERGLHAKDKDPRVAEMFEQFLESLPYDDEIADLYDAIIKAVESD